MVLLFSHDNIELTTLITAVYNASKAALTMFSETLRLELAPLGVRVVSVITGAVDTNIMRNSSMPMLPPSSRYLAAKKQIIDLAMGAAEDGVQRMATEAFAEKVVGDVLGGANGKIWRGEYASTVRVSSVLMPMGVLVSLCYLFLVVGTNGRLFLAGSRVVQGQRSRSSWLVFKAS